MILVKATECYVGWCAPVIVDKRATDGEKVNVLAAALARFPLEDVFMSEETRALIAKHAPK